MNELTHTGNRISTVTVSGLKNDLLLKALMGKVVDRPPVWIMRQAGRYLPDYQKLRAKYDFFTRVRTPELACEITLQPVDQIGVDAAIIFSDILVIPQAMGLEVQMLENKGPVLPNPVRKVDDLGRVSELNVEERLQYVFDAIRLTRQTLDGRVPLIGFAGAPWTIFCYMIQGQGSKTFDQAKIFCRRQPGETRKLLEMITRSTIIYLRAQAEAGADVLQLFDSWAGLLSKKDFETFSLPYIRRIVDALTGYCPMIVFAKGAWYGIKEISATGAAIGLDWSIDPKFAREQAGVERTLQGNLDPSKLFESPAEIRKSVNEMIHSFGIQNYIVNLGHGILPGVPVASAKAFVDAVKEYSNS